MLRLCDKVTQSLDLKNFTLRFIYHSHCRNIGISYDLASFKFIFRETLCCIRTDIFEIGICRLSILHFV